MKFNFGNAHLWMGQIKSLLVGFVFTGLGIYCLSLNTCSNIKLALNPSITDVTVTEIEADFNEGRAYRIKGNFDFSSYYEIKEVNNRDGGYSEDVKEYLYRFMDESSNFNILIKSDSPPESMQMFYKDKHEIVITVKVFNSGESFNLFVADHRNNYAATDSGVNISSLIKKLNAGEKIEVKKERVSTSSFYGEIYYGSDDVKWNAIGELIKYIFLSGILIILGVNILLDVFENFKN